MTEVDVLIKEKFVSFRRKVLEHLKEKHPYIIGIVESAMAGRKNKFGLRITENGKTVGEYTLIANGVSIESVEVGILDAAVKHPMLGEFKPYAIIERSDIEQAIENEEFFTDTFAAAKKFLPNATIKFLE
ncbi:hypothetical protein [Dendrosporobacter sp. 1207_IL3150]|uniref:hypothetical protein n=1 Tax=Dendrosporobacter sp. 1207_IL3150 TaxID=3084054 RepID=UPI002FD9455A